MTPPEPFFHLLIVDDDARLRGLLAEYLGKEGFAVTMATNAADARRKLAMFLFDLMVLDVMMPGEDGIAFAGALRREGNETPILMLTAMGEAEDRIHGLESGADDYLVKPFEPRELVLRIHSILRRGGGATSSLSAASAIVFGAFRFRARDAQLEKDGKPVYLTTAEASLLARLAAKAGEAVSRTELAESLPGDGENERSVDVQITRLRKKIEAEPARPHYIQTVRGAGYMLRVS